MREIVLPWPPSLNGHKTVARGRLILSKHGREYIKECKNAVIEQRIKPIEGYLDVTLSLYPPDKRTRDVDNYIKAVFDAMTQAGVWGDDSQVKRLTVEMLEVVKGGKAIICAKCKEV